MSNSNNTSGYQDFYYGDGGNISELPVEAWAASSPVPPPTRAHGSAVATLPPVLQFKLLITGGAPNTFHLGQHISRFVTEPKVEGIIRGNITETGMTSAGPQGVFLIRISYDIEAGYSPAELARKVEEYAEQELRLLARTTAWFLPGTTEGSMVYCHAVVDEAGERHDGVIQDFLLTIEGPGGPGALPDFLNMLIFAANSPFDARDIGAQQDAPDHSVTRVVLRFTDMPAGESVYEIADRVRFNLAARLPDYLIRIEPVVSPLGFFGYGALDPIRSSDEE